MARPLAALLSLWLATSAALVLAPSAGHATAADDCLKIDARPPDMFDQDARDKALKRWIEVCRQAADAEPRQHSPEARLGARAVCRRAAAGGGRALPRDRSHGRRRRELPALRDAQVLRPQRAGQAAAHYPHRSRGGAAQGGRARPPLLHVDPGRAARPRQHGEARSRRRDPLGRAGDDQAAEGHERGRYRGAARPLPRQGRQSRGAGARHRDPGAILRQTRAR